MNVEHCLNRIGYKGPINPDITCLRALQLAFLLKVPFENFDIHLGRKISLYPEDIFGKIVKMGRGGVCYETNILFFELLSAIGYKAEYLSARLVKGRKMGPDYDHMALRVALGNHDYLIDVGRGLSLREPVRLDGSAAAKSEDCFYRINSYGKDYAVYEKRPEGQWTPRLIFSTTPRSRSEFEDMNRCHQESPDSFFLRRRLATIATAGGKVTLVDRCLSITDRSKKLEKQHLGTEAQYRQCLKRYFGIELDTAGPWPSLIRPGNHDVSLPPVRQLR